VQRGDVIVSAISAWEIALLEAARRIELSVDMRAWVGRALAFPGVQLGARDERILAYATHGHVRVVDANP
jgi:PIN domain nuclease of toxin-antitoxin system